MMNDRNDEQPDPRAEVPGEQRPEAGGLEPEPSVPAPLRPIVPLVVAGALFIEFLDSSIVATALPSMAADLGVPAQALSLTITVYLVSLAVVVPASGWIADRFGARRVLVCALLGFLAGSVVSGSSQSVTGLLVGRAMQGAAGALMMPVGRLIVLKTVPRHQVMQAWIWLTMPALLGPMLGPPLGGVIVTMAHWRWIFWVNVPIGLAGIALALTFLPAVREDRVPRFDVRGFLLGATAVASGVFALEAIGRKVLPAWSSLALGLTCAAAVVLYVRHARRHPEPIIDLRLFRLPTFRASVVGGSIFRIAVGASPFLLPLQLQVGFGQSALRAGLTIFVGALGAMAVKPAVAPLVARFGFKRMLTANAIIAAVLMSSLALVTRDTPQAVTMALIFAGGFFRSLEFTTIATMSYADVERERLSKATTIAGMFQQISMSFGVALAAGLLHLVTGLRGATAAAAPDYSLALLIVGIASGTSALMFARMPADAGAQLLLQRKRGG